MARAKPYSRTSDDCLCIEHQSIENWIDERLWTRYLSGVERIVGASLSRLDTRDPPRRKAEGLSPLENARFITDFQPQETARFLIAKFKQRSLSFIAFISRDDPENLNWLRWSLHYDERSESEAIRRASKLFDLGNRLLRPFYSFADLCSRVSDRSHPDRGIDPEEQLRGVFWLTYFDQRYREFFGERCFAAIPEATPGVRGGMALRLSGRPDEYPARRVSAIEKHLGAAAFLQPGRHKPRGKHVLTCEQLGRKLAPSKAPRK